MLEAMALDVRSPLCCRSLGRRMPHNLTLFALGCAVLRWAAADRHGSGTRHGRQGRGDIPAVLPRQQRPQVRLLRSFLLCPLSYGFLLTAPLLRVGLCFRLVTFLKEWASTTSEPNIYDVAVVHLITNSMLRLSDDEVRRALDATSRCNNRQAALTLRVCLR